MEINQEQFLQWRQHPVTHKVWEFLRERRQLIMEQWANEGYMAKTPEESAVNNALALGSIRLINEMIYIQLGDIDESKRDTPEG